MVLSPKFQVSDSQIRDQVKTKASENNMIGKLPSLLEVGEANPHNRQDSSAVNNNTMALSKKEKRALEYLRNRSGLSRSATSSTLAGSKTMRAGLATNTLSRDATVPTLRGRRNAAASDDNITVNVYFPFTGDTIRMHVDQNLPLSAPRTPVDIKNNRFFQYWGRNADHNGYSAGREDDDTPRTRKSKCNSLKTKLQELTGYSREHMRIIHPQTRMVFSGPHRLCDYGICHGQRLCLLHQKPPSVSEVLKLPKHERQAAYKYVPSLSSSVKARKSSERGNSNIQQLAKTQDSSLPYRVMPRWDVNAQGVKMADLKFEQSHDLGDNTIFFEKYDWMPDRGKSMDAVADIRETFEKKRDYLNKKNDSLSSPTKLKAALRVVLGKNLTKRDAFSAWKIMHMEKMRQKSDFLRDMTSAKTKMDVTNMKGGSGYISRLDAKHNKKAWEDPIGM